MLIKKCPVQIRLSLSKLLRIILIINFLPLHHPPGTMRGFSVLNTELKLPDLVLDAMINRRFFTDNK